MKRLLTIALPLLLLLAIVRLWLMPMWSSFWVDEMGTAFVVQHGASHPSFAVAPQVPQSSYYLLPAVSALLLGTSEFSYRLPSFLAMGVALFLIARLAARLIHPGAGWLAVFACLGMRGIDYQAADARPYALGTLVACAALWFLVRWLDSARRLDALLFLVAAALLWRVQLIFWPFYLVFGVYALTRLAQRDTPVPWGHAVVALLVLAGALVPVLQRALALYRHAGAHVVVALPSIRDLLFALKPGLILLCGAGAWLLARARHWTAAAVATPPASVILLLAWWLCQPLGLFVFSWVTGNSVFVSRYLSLSLPGGAVVAALLVVRFLPQEHWRMAAAALGLGALLLNGQWDRVRPWHHNSDWRAAARQLRQMQLSEDIPVLCPSPFVEAAPPAWRPDYPLPGFLYAHLDVYPIPGAIALFPFATSPQAEQFATVLSTEVLKNRPRFVLYGGQGQVDFWTNWLSARPELAGWNQQRLRSFGDVEVVTFRNPAPYAQIRPEDCDRRFSRLGCDLEAAPKVD